jgi:hypothetical protein
MHYRTLPGNVLLFVRRRGTLVVILVAPHGHKLMRRHFKAVSINSIGTGLTIHKKLILDGSNGMPSWTACGILSQRPSADMVHAVHGTGHVHAAIQGRSTNLAKSAFAKLGRAPRAHLLRTLRDGDAVTVAGGDFNVDQDSTSPRLANGTMTHGGLAQNIKSIGSLLIELCTGRHHKRRPQSGQWFRSTCCGG